MIFLILVSARTILLIGVNFLLYNICNKVLNYKGTLIVQVLSEVTQLIKMPLSSFYN